MRLRFPIATYDTDYLLVPGALLASAIAALRGAGHVIEHEGQGVVGG